MAKKPVTYIKARTKWVTFSVILFSALSALLFFALNYSAYLLLNHDFNIWRLFNVIFLASWLVLLVCLIINCVIILLNNSTVAIFTEKHYRIMHMFSYVGDDWKNTTNLYITEFSIIPNTDFLIKLSNDEVDKNVFHKLLPLGFFNISYWDISVEDLVKVVKKYKNVQVHMDWYLKYRMKQEKELRKVA